MQNRNHPGVYQNSIPVAGQFYTSSGYEGVLEGKFPTRGKLGQMKGNADQYICNLIQKGKNNVPKTNGGLLWFLQGNNQYVTSATFLITAYADFLARNKKTIQCLFGVVGSQDLINFARSQVDYILGSNPNRLSYMVGFGPNYPKQVHHRGASIVSIKKDPRPVGCGQGYVEWFNKNAENPNVIIGAIVAGPDQGDKFNDSRQNPGQTEPSTYNNAPFVGVLARLAS
ncbi:hypothetical protein DH2020_022338 [Rehmannia glutinosa]|uniref:Endoglucanase n=1 Tax=Rehmannia glutinosa TaxID=99300 RepID=A0ABR0WF99_REHGL